MKPINTIDFETKKIGKRPAYPPEAVGVAFSVNGKDEQYLAWGHPEGNNCTKEQAKKKIVELYKSGIILCHNGKFDLEVAEAEFDLPLIPPHGWHDSMLLAFLHNPREPNLKLKLLADKWSGLKPVEQEKLHQWVKQHVFTSKKGGEGKVFVGTGKPKGWFSVPDSQLGGFVAYTPVKIAAPYAKGDIKRTYRLYKKFIKYVTQHGMLPQYDIELRCVIKAIEMERQGVNIDVKTLAPDLAEAKKTLQKAEHAVQKKLGDINLNSSTQKIEAFERLGLVDEWEYTDKGNPKTSIDSLIIVCKDKQLVKNLNIYSKYTKLIGTYMQPWLDSALENNGLFFPWFNTIRGDNDKGTYTGRFSSNFQQVPRKPKDVYQGMPFLRNYIIADSKKQILFDRDFASQEIRILAHFEDGELLAAYLANPHLDVHDHVRIIMTEMTAREYDRSDHVKPCNFLVIYGGGPPALSRNIHVPIEEAREIFNAHADALPGVQELKDDLMQMSYKGQMFKTAGGRWYSFEHGKEYVALNTLIQGSAGDHSKRALLNIDDMIKAEGYEARIMLPIHDEFLLSGPRGQKKQFMLHFKEAMEHDELFDLPMLTDGKIGDRWGQMKKVKW